MTIWSYVYGLNLAIVSSRCLFRYLIILLFRQFPRLALPASGRDWISFKSSKSLKPGTSL